MEIFTMSLLTLVVGSTIFVLTWLLLKEKTKSAELLRHQAATSQIVSLKQLEVIERAFAQLRAADPWQYQNIMSVAQPSLYDVEYDPSEEAEAQRIADRNNQSDEMRETLSAEESAAVSDIFPGYAFG